MFSFQVFFYAYQCFINGLIFYSEWTPTAPEAKLIRPKIYLAPHRVLQVCAVALRVKALISK